MNRISLYARRTYLGSGVAGFLAWCLWPNVWVFVLGWVGVWLGSIAVNLIADRCTFPDDQPDAEIERRKAA